MTTHEIRQRIKEELTNLIRNDEQTWSIVLDLAREHFADRKQTEDRFDVMMQELRDDRAAQMRKWEENNRRWEEDSRRWDENSRRWEEDSRRWEEDSGRWDENSRRWDENNRRLEENNRRWDENNRRWDENKNNFDRMHEEIMAIAKKQHDNMSAIGARWGIYAEESFRNGLAAILEKSFGVEVLNVTEYDDQGEVFGRPDQIELDVIMRNGTLIICEIKSSMDRGSMYLFERKVRYYKKHHNRICDRMLVIAPWIDPRAYKVADNLGIETYSHSTDVKLI